MVKMSVKTKVKRCNKEIKRLEEELETYKLSNERLKQKLDSQIDNKLLENIVKFAVTNYLGGLYGGVKVERYGIDKMQDLKLSVEYEPEFNSYMIKVNYNKKNFY